MAATELKGEARVLDMADRMRRLGAGTVQPHRLYFECVEAFRRGELEFDRVTSLYRHAMLHSGAIVPRGRARFHHCPECEVALDVPALDN